MRKLHAIGIHIDQLTNAGSVSGAGTFDSTARRAKFWFTSFLKQIE
jgi:hypothetical protein